MELYQITPYILMIVSLFFIGQALFVIIRKKPLIFNSTWSVAVLSLCFLPMMFSSIGILSKAPSFVEILTILVFVAWIIWLIIQMSGYTILGADDADFEKSLHECLNENNYEFEQNLSKVKIKKPEIEFHVAIQPWIGTVHLRPKGKANQYVLKDLMRDLSQKKIKVNYASPILIILVAGVFLLLVIN